jgi:hypothetical protein
MKENYERNTFVCEFNVFFKLLHVLENNKCIPENMLRAKAHISASALAVFLGPKPSMTQLAIIFRKSAE